MYDKTKQVLSFPHFIMGNVLNNKKHVFNDINGGMKQLADFNLVRNKFLGGNVELFGKVKEYGFYICPHYENKTVLGFYIHDPSIVTELGKKIVQERYPDAKIVWEKVAPIDKQLSAAEIKKRKELIDKAKEKGANESEVSHATLDELDGLLQAMDSGKASRAVVEMAGVDASDKNKKVVIRHNSKAQTKARR